MSHKKKGENITWHQYHITKTDREKKYGYKGVVIWFTGLPSSGKSTLANELEERLFERGCHTYILDGDNIRHGLNFNLGFSVEDRQENIRRIGEVAKLFATAGTIVLTAFISPYRADREKARNLLPEGEFIEVYVHCDISVCKERDPKGLYKKAEAGEIPEFTGVSAPYEEPLMPEIFLNNDKNSITESVSKIIKYLEEKNIIPESLCD